MTIEELKNAIGAVVNNPHSMQLYLILKEARSFEIRLADLGDKRTEPEMRRLFDGYLKQSIVDDENVRMKKLSAAEDEDNAIYLYDYPTCPDEMQLLKNFNIREGVQQQKFNFHQDDLSKLYGYIIYLGTMDEGIVLFKKHYPISLIKRDSFLLGAIKDAGRFEKIEGEDIIRLNGSIQLLRKDNEIYVLDLKSLERNMGFTEIVKKEALASIEEIEKLEIVEDIEVLKDTIGEQAFARKISRIRKSSLILKLGIKKDDIVKFTKETPELRGKFKYSADGNQIRLDTKKSKDLFVKLMNDSFLKSELTDQYYEALAKDEMSRL